MAGRRWDRATIESSLELSRGGLSDYEVARILGVPRATVRNWRVGLVPVPQPVTPDGACRWCHRLEHDFSPLRADVYAYLLGVYLGDGCLVTSRTPRLQVTLDVAYPGIIRECAEAVAAISGREPRIVPDSRGTACVNVCCIWRPWPCLFPQHGPGRKHTRPIVLEPWQQALVDQAPGMLLRGLIHTDGWRGVNRVVSKGRAYEYPRYQFSNRSDDIRAIFTGTCDRLGIEWRRWGRWHVSVARRASVARLDELVGLKT